MGRLFSRGAGIMKPTYSGASWKQSGAKCENNCRCLRSTGATGAKSHHSACKVCGAMAKDWYEAQQDKATAKVRANGGFRTLMPVKVPRRNNRQKHYRQNSFGNTALSRRGLMSSCSAR